MAFPSAAHQELGILRAIGEVGGWAMKEDPSFYRLAALYFPEISDDDLRQADPETGKDLWTSKCQQLFARMVKRREIEYYGAELGITPVGQARLKKQWLPEWGPNPVYEPPAPEEQGPGPETPPQCTW
jgi:hypothetical protein